MSASVLADRYQDIAGAPARRPIVLAPSADLTRGPGRLLAEVTQALVTELEREGSGAESRLLRSTLEDALISVILGLPGNHSGGLEAEPRPDLAPWLVRRAEEYMAAHAADPITLFDLVAVCGCSRSALCHAFKSSRGHTPMQFLARRRLELARARLLREPGATATEIALDCGFGNHGRFAKAYRSRFGELPSETGARCHGPQVSRADAPLIRR
jgi:AraC-like DNA-binding protein